MPGRGHVSELHLSILSLNVFIRKPLPCEDSDSFPDGASSLFHAAHLEPPSNDTETAFLGILKEVLDGSNLGMTTNIMNFGCRLDRQHQDQNTYSETTGFERQNISNSDHD